MDGIESYFGAFNPKGIEGSQYSSFRMTLSNGDDSLKMGLMVNPSLFKDNKTRLFTHIVDYMSTGPNSRESVWLLQSYDDLPKVGLWPTKAFGRFNDFGNQADWGGEVYSPLDQPSPPMGTGIHPHGDTSYAAHSHLIAISYENSQSKFVNPGDAVLYESDPKSYSVSDSGYRNGYWRRLILYDGPGGIKSD
ncbi:uncharacterized protein LOC122280359 [Carya illinoinensis]|uniref:Neprosin PEP catalytic domain-containing protein n=1 Tax=Carya illinoinensis TaxID=32201 RepID=A0A8T1P2Z9_CARIL|nr:uncharacterized protein LOC122280359 [Carya illinoinensis]KAG6635753.1 hypothetical protein CIPAW_11G064300 [Carya illinoinensis]